MLTLINFSPLVEISGPPPDISELSSKGYFLFQAAAAPTIQQPPSIHQSELCQVRG